MNKNLEIIFMRNIVYNKFLKPTERITLLYLLKQSQIYNVIDDSDSLLGESLGISERTISSCVKRLKELNYIIVKIEKIGKCNKRIIEINYSELEKRIYIEI